MREEQEKIREALRDVLSEPGSKTKENIIRAMDAQHGFSEGATKIELADMIHEGEIEEHPEIDGVWRLADK